MQQSLTPQNRDPDLAPDQPGLRGNSGLTLLELALAILVLSLASLAALRSSDQSRRAIGGEMARLMARVAVQNRIEELALYGREAGGLPQQIRIGPQQIRLDHEIKPTAGGLLRFEVTGRAQSGEGASLVAYLPSAARP
jgi:general secretion pathway protein I